MRGVPITEGRHVQAHLLLPVPLVEELLHAPGSPLPVQGPALGRVRHVRAVQNHAHHFRLVNAATETSFIIDIVHTLHLKSNEKPTLECVSLEDLAPLSAVRVATSSIASWLCWKVYNVTVL